MCYILIIYIFLVYNRRGYVEVVSRLAEHSMQAAVEEVQTLPDYPTNGEVSIMSSNMFHVIVYWPIVGHHRCSPRLNRERLSYHSALPLWKVLL